MSKVVRRGRSCYLSCFFSIIQSVGSVTFRIVLSIRRHDVIADWWQFEVKPRSLFPKPHNPQTDLGEINSAFHVAIIYC